METFQTPSPRVTRSLKLNAAYAEDWMFLNTTYQDFCSRPGAIDQNSSTPMRVTLATELPSSNTLQPSELEPEDELYECNNDGNETVQERNYDADIWLDDNWATTELPTPFVLPYNPSPLGLGSDEMFLLDYFTNGLIPRCHLARREPFHQSYPPHWPVCYKRATVLQHNGNILPPAVHAQRQAF